MSMIDPMARVRGLGSAKEGTHHWIAQRMTAVALIPLTLWFVISLIGLIGADLAAVKDWLSSPFNAVMMILNWITPSPPERKLWSPITTVIFALAVAVHWF